MEDDFKALKKTGDEHQDNREDHFHGGGGDGVKDKTHKM